MKSEERIDNLQWNSETKTMFIESHKFLEKIHEKRKISFPKFKLLETEFFVRIEFKYSDYISVYLHQHSQQIQTVSYTFEDESGVKKGITSDKINAGKGRGLREFRSVENYRAWAGQNEDVFRLKATVTLHRMQTVAEMSPIVSRSKSKPKLEPRNQETIETLSSFGRIIMEDDRTSDLTLVCGTRTFKVHKVILCARSPVFRAMILSDLAEAKKGEFKVSDVDEETLGSMIHYIYTGELETREDLDVQMLTYAAGKYNLPGLIDLFCNKMRQENLKAEKVADLLISAYRSESKEVREVALERIRANRDILREEKFRCRMKKADPIIILDLFNFL